MRLLPIIPLTLGALVTLARAEPSPRSAPVPTAVTFARAGASLGEVGGELSKQSGVPIAVAPALLKIKCGATFDKAPFWSALQQSADTSGARIVVREGGARVELQPRGGSKEVVATSGPFRVVAQGVTGRALLDAGATFHEVTLLVHWEPRLKVYRIDTTPRVRALTDDRGSKLRDAGGSAQVLPSGATAEMKVRIEGVPRKAERLTALAGAFHATVAERLLEFKFEAPGGTLPPPQKLGGVTGALKKLQKKGNTWEVVLELDYPPGVPVFQSFEGQPWLRDNRLRLRSPDGNFVTIDEYEIPQPDQTSPLRVIHRFDENAKAGFGNPTGKGWALVYETPAPLADVAVPFELKDIPLP
ncbi:hypothetical protein R5W23_003964 [Gemmata sp. JC673]|uniref:FecR protein domain-containing protein n=1 Tax=Gemmata algarum TaxID=2975278 RepID=A0ABU5F820_9BACT|nr:hypothetical protein [Gemmata algarum]MDY3562498.1 hypothetical protein [Gemmata algarum]